MEVLEIIRKLQLELDRIEEQIQFLERLDAGANSRLAAGFKSAEWNQDEDEGTLRLQ